MAPSEVELKFRLDEEQRRAIEVRLGAAGEPRRLESIYFDGSGLPMRRAGYSVRVRSDEGRRTMTVKTLAFAAQRGEWTRPQQDETPDRAFLFSTPAGVALDGEALLPQFQTETLRSDLLLQEGETVVQASFDEGRTFAGALASPFAELELELKSGGVETLFDLASRLRTAFSLRPIFQSKAERGFALLDGGGPARRFERPQLDGAASAGEGFRLIARAALRQIAADADALSRLGASEAPIEAIHQLRVGVRRMRSAMKAFTEISADAESEPIDGELKWLQGELDEVRALDVAMAGPLARAERTGRSRRRLATLRRELSDRRGVAAERACAAASSQRTSKLLFEAFRWIEIGPWTRVAGPKAALRDGLLVPCAASALGEAHRRVELRARRFAELGRKGRHKLRIRVKRFRYLADVVDQAFEAHPRRSRKQLAATRALTDVLGALNDIASGEVLFTGAPKWLRRGQARREERLLRRAADRIADWQRCDAFWPNGT